MGSLERKKLWDEWQALSRKVQALSGIVQNDMDLQEEQIKEWRDISFRCWNHLKDLTGRTLQHLREPLWDVFIHSESDCVWHEKHQSIPVHQDPCVERVLAAVSEAAAVEEVKRLQGG